MWRGVGRRLGGGDGEEIKGSGWTGVRRVGWIVKGMGRGKNGGVMVLVVWFVASYLNPR